MGKDKFIDTLVNDAYKHSVRTLFRKVVPYEERFQKPVHQFTAREFIQMFSEEKWSKGGTFRANRYKLCSYFDWLEAQKIKTSKYLLINLSENDIPAVSRFACYFYSFAEIAEAYQMFFPEALGSHFYNREMLCSLLSMLGLTAEQLLDLREKDICLEQREIHLNGLVMKNIPDPFVPWICELMHADGYNTKNSYKKFDFSDYVVKRAALSGSRDDNYIKNLVYQSVRIANKQKKTTKFAEKSFLPKDLAISYLYCHLWQYEQESDDLLTKQAVLRRGEWLVEKLAEWNGIGLKYAASKWFFIEDYMQWKAYKENMG